MRTSVDVIRSLAKYLSQSLSGWTIVYADEEGVFKRPFLKIEAATPGRATAHGPAQQIKQRTYSIVAYPVEMADSHDSRLEAERVTDLLHDAFTVGTHEPSFGRRQNSGQPDKSWRRRHPFRVPLYDFAAADNSNETVDEDAREPNDFMRVVEDPTFGVLEGASRTDEEETLYVVTGDVRVSWSRPTGVLEDAVPTESVKQKRLP